MENIEKIEELLKGLHTFCGSRFCWSLGTSRITNKFECRIFPRSQDPIELAKWTKIIHVSPSLGSILNAINHVKEEKGKSSG